MSIFTGEYAVARIAAWKAVRSLAIFVLFAALISFLLPPLFSFIIIVAGLAYFGYKYIRAEINAVKAAINDDRKLFPIDNKPISR